MVLAKDAILKAIKSGEIKISPFKKSQVGSGSIDLALSDEFRVFKKNLKQISIRESTDYKKYTKKIRSKSIIIKPGEMILGITKEKIKLAPNICGWLQGRSRFARIGLSIHITASFVQPGSENRQVLEIINLGSAPLKLYSGEKILQLILDRTEGESKFKGKFRNQVL